MFSFFGFFVLRSGDSSICPSVFMPAYKCGIRGVLYNLMRLAISENSIFERCVFFSVLKTCGLLLAEMRKVDSSPSQVIRQSSNCGPPFNRFTLTKKLSNGGPQ